MPLTSGRVLGTLVLLWDEQRDFTAEERVTIATLASYAAQAVQRALLLEQRETASLTLQTAMLTRLPETAGMDLTARYRPAAVHDRVGGDWYDAVVTPTGETNLMVGDVAGHDIAAAAVMNELRSTLRTLAWAGDDCPATDVARLDEAMAAFGVDRFASLVFARVGRPDGSGKRSLVWTNAGHLPPLVVHPDGTTELLDDGGDPDVLVGIEPGRVRRNQHTEIPDGSVLVLYTDGLVERRTEDIGTGLDRLAATATRHLGDDLGSFVDGLVDELVGDTHEDDVALLAVRFG